MNMPMKYMIDDVVMYGGRQCKVLEGYWISADQKNWYTLSGVNHRVYEDEIEHFVRG